MIFLVINSIFDEIETKYKNFIVINKKIIFFIINCDNYKNYNLNILDNITKKFTI